MFNREFHATTTAPRSTVWAIWSDVNHWSTWNAGVEQAHIAGPFVSGAEFTMTPGGQQALRCRLSQVEPGVAFTDVTELGDICVTVEHRIESLDQGQLRVVYRAQVTGPGAEQVGAAITEDFDDVLAALVTLAERGLATV